MNLLNIQNLTVSFNDKKAVDDLSIELKPYEIVGLLGESGCGKSLTAYSALGIAPPNAKIFGTINYNDFDILSLNNEEKRKIRGNKLALIPQDPLSALNPVLTIGEQISEVLITHKGLSQKEAMDISQKALSNVNISNPKEKLNDYPHQLSGGMRQRVLIAMALATEPDVLIADEPTTALDVTIQLQILRIMKELKNKGKSILVITHDLAVVSELCDRLYVMYLGKIVESGTTKEILLNPKHPYTIGLLASLPDETKEKLLPIQGQPPTINLIPPGCSFHPRCPYVMEKCTKQIPELYEIKDSSNHKSRCFLEDI